MRYGAAVFGVGFRSVLAIILLLVAAWLPRPGSSGPALPVSDQPMQTFTVTTTADDGAGSLRQAIIDANTAAGMDTIAFSIGTGPASIQLFSNLPDITGPVLIDGTTQPGFSGTPLIELQNFGFKVTGGGSTLRSLAVTGGDGVVLETGGGNTVTGCDLTGLTDGILISNSSNNQIGGTTAGSANNIGNNSYGVRINGAASAGNIVTGNYIGLFSDGSDGRNTLVGVAIEGAPNNRIGGTTAGERNIISNNGGGSTTPSNLFRGNVFITGAGATGNLVQGNYIGTNIAGTADGAMTINGNRHNGVRIEEAANNVVGGIVGTTPGGACTGACNVISGNKTNGGVYVTGAGSTGNMILGNFIGTNAEGTAAIINIRGVTITGGASNNTIGNATAAGRNVISGATAGLQDDDGAIVLDGNNNTVHGNYIGADTTGSQSLVNSPNGILIKGTDNIIGTGAGTTYGGACTGGCNVIVPAGGPGIKILGTTNPIGHNTVDYNYIGLNAAGDAALLGVNFPGAIWIVNSDQNTIGRLPALDSEIVPSDQDEVPDAIYCISQETEGVYFEFSDLTGMYTWKECRSGRTFTGVGTVTTTPGKVFFKTPERASAIVNVVTGTGSAWIPVDFGPFEKTFSFQDADVNRNDCECPTQGRAAHTSGTYIRGSTGSSNNVVAGTIDNQTVNDPSSNLTPAGSSPINIDRGSGNIIRTVSSSNAEPDTRIAIGTRNEWYPTSHLSLQTQTGVLFDLNNNGTQDPNDPGDADGGANNGQNWPYFDRVQKTGLFEWEIGGRINTNPDTTLSISLFGEASHMGTYYFRPGRPTGEASPLITRRTTPLHTAPLTVTTDANGDAVFTFQSVLGLEFFDHIRATAKVIAPAARAGDTSEMSPAAAVPGANSDLDGDGKTDIAVFRPSPGNGSSFWYVLSSADGSIRSQQFGLGEDQPVVGDYQSDGKADLAVRRSSNGTWYTARLTGDPATNFDAVQWGNSTDIPVVGDFLDLRENQQAVFRASEGTWYIRNPIDNTAIAQRFGIATDKPVPADYSGDGRTDVAVFRDGTWFISACPECPVRYEFFGQAGDVPVPADYDGDGAADIGVWRPSTGIWYLNQSTDGFTAFQWGSNGDVPVNGDFDGDGKNDIAVWRPSSGIWYILRSTAGFYAVQWGQNGDIPVPKFQN